MLSSKKERKSASGQNEEKINILEKLFRSP